MKPEIADKWTDALESGEFQQTKGALAIKKALEPPKYCCLGVLCELYAREKKINSFSFNETGPDGKVGKFLDQTIVLPEEVIEWAKLRSANGVVLEYGSPYSKRVCLSSLNDRGFSFKDIAKAIRKYKYQL